MIIVVSAVHMSTFHFKDDLIHDFVTKEQLDSGGVSNRPLHDLAMCLEHMRVGCMSYALRSSRSVVYERNTASCLYRAPKERNTQILEDIKYEDLHILRDHYEGKQNRLNEHCAMRCSEAAKKGEKAFRVQEATEDDLLKCTPKRPSRSFKLALKNVHWNDMSIAHA